MALWYVDGALGTGSNNGTSWANAWRTIGAISWGSIAAADTLYLSGGSSSQTYTGSGSTTILSVGASGTTGNPITITKGVDVGHTGTVIIDGQSGGRTCIDILGRNYVVVQQLTAQNPGAGFDCIFINGNSGTMSGVVIQDNTLHVGGTNSNAHSVGIECKNITGVGSTSNTFQRNYIDTGDSGGANGTNYTDQTDCIYVQNVTVDNAVLIQNNTCIQRNSNSTGHNDCIQFVSNGALTIYANYLEQTYNGNNTHCLILSDPADGKTYSVINNICRTNGAQPNGAILQNTINTNTATNGIFKLYNNTFDVQGWCISFASVNVASEIKNNIIHADGASSFGFVSAYVPTSVNQVDYNDVYLTNGASFSDGSTTGWNAHGQSGPPLFVAASNYPLANYHILAGSAAINNGTTLAAVPLDYVGLSRPQGTSYCIGAYEFMPLAISGTPVSGNTTGASLALPAFTASGTNLVVVVGVIINGGVVTSISDTAGLTWNRRVAGGGGQFGTEEWYAISSGALSSDIITINQSGAGYIAAGAFAISGARVSPSPFDQNAALPAVGSSGDGSAIPDVTATTSTANDIIIGIYRASVASPTAGTGFTAAIGAGFMLIEYQIVSATQSALDIPLGGGATNNGGIGDAIVISGTPFVATKRSTILLMGR